MELRKKRLAAAALALLLAAAVLWFALRDRPVPDTGLVTLLRGAETASGKILSLDDYELSWQQAGSILEAVASSSPVEARLKEAPFGQGTIRLDVDGKRVDIEVLNDWTACVAYSPGDGYEHRALCGGELCEETFKGIFHRADPARYPVDVIYKARHQNAL